MFARIMAVAAPIGEAGVFVQDVLAAMTPVHPKTYWRASINKITDAGSHSHDEVSKYEKYKKRITLN